MGLILVKFLGGTYPLSESVKLFLDELAKSEIDEVAKEELLKNPLALSEKEPSMLAALTQDPKFNLADMKKYDIRMSENILARLPKTEDKKSVLMQAYVFCPYLQDVYLSCVRSGLLDFDTYKTAEYLGYSERVLDEIVSVISEHCEDKEFTTGLVSVYAQAKGLAEDRVWASFDMENVKEQAAAVTEVKEESPAEIRRKEKAAARKEKAEEKKREKEEIKRKAEARKRVEAKRKEQARKEKEEARRKLNAEAGKAQEEAVKVQEEAKTVQVDAGESKPEEVVTEGTNINKKKSKKGILLIAGIVLACLLFLLWKFSSAPEGDESVDATVDPVVTQEADEQSEPLPEEEGKSDQEVVEENMVSLRDDILSVLDGDNVYEYNEETQLYGFEKDVINTTNLTLENVTLEVTVGADINTYNRDVWNPGEEWTIRISASEDTLVDDDFVIGAEITHVTYQSYTK